MTTSPPWMRALADAVRRGLNALYKEPPLTAVEWADTHFYLSSESSYQQGRWVTAAFQVAILNAMGNDLIRVFNLHKSARVGYTKMLMAKVVSASYTVPPTGGRVAQFSVCADEDALEAMIGAMTRQRVQQPMKIGRIRSVFDLGALYA